MKTLKKATISKKNNKSTKPKAKSTEPYQTVFGGKDRKLWLTLPLTFLIIISLYVMVLRIGSFRISLDAIFHYSFFFEPFVNASFIAAFAVVYVYKLVFKKHIPKIATIIAYVFAFAALVILILYMTAGEGDADFALIIIFNFLLPMLILSITGIITLLFNPKKKI